MGMENIMIIIEAIAFLASIRKGRANIISMQTITSFFVMKKIRISPSLLIGIAETINI
ncbi:MAG: hypothetical protein F7B61_00450 [Caldisphaeraceae archaeon]|nr:hypothetical protein [Caldisphaeraceae archaeon]